MVYKIKTPTLAGVTLSPTQGFKKEIMKNDTIAIALIAGQLIIFFILLIYEPFINKTKNHEVIN